MEQQRQLEFWRQRIEDHLAGRFAETGLTQAMGYSLLAGGKRIRPILTLWFCIAAGGDAEACLDAACGVEMLHTYSLIHDDLPCMDNDDLRRGKPTCHKVYGECTATLAGDALQAAAFEYVLREPDLEPEARARMGLTLARAVGVWGMCGGQYLDMEGEGRTLTLDELNEIHSKKTAALLKAACQIGVLAAGVKGETEEMLRAADAYAEHIGMAFQIRDDLLDELATTEQLGKPVGSDRANNKCTFASLLGREACLRLIEEHTELAKKALEGAFQDRDALCWLADALAGRTN